MSTLANLPISTEMFDSQYISSTFVPRDGTMVSGDIKLCGTFHIEDGSITHGISAIANKNDGIALNNSKCHGAHSIAIAGGLAYGTGGLAIGHNATVGEKHFISQNSYQSWFGFSSTARGMYTYAIGEECHAEGNETSAYGSQSHAEGWATIAGIKGFSVSTVIPLSDWLSDYMDQNLTACIGDGKLLSGYTGITVDFPNIKTYAGTLSNALYNDTQYSNLSLYILPYIYPWNECGYDEHGNLINYTKFFRITYDGAQSHAEGIKAKTSNKGSHAEGIETKAYGYGSHAEGNNAYAEGSQSHAEGCATSAIGTDSHVEGRYSYSYGAWSHAEGYETSSTGMAAHSEGYRNIADAQYSHAEGLSTTTLDRNHPVYNGSHTEGCETSAQAYCAHAEGYKTFAKGNYSHAEGYTSITKPGHDYSYVWSGLSTYPTSRGKGTFAIYPQDDAKGFYIGVSSLQDYLDGAGGGGAEIVTLKSDVKALSATDNVISDDINYIASNVFGDTDDVEIPLNETTGGFYQANGNIAKNDKWTSFSYSTIEVEKGKTYAITTTLNGNAAIVLLDSDKKLIRCIASGIETYKSHKIYIESTLTSTVYLGISNTTYGSNRTILMKLKVKPYEHEKPIVDYAISAIDTANVIKSQVDVIESKFRSYQSPMVEGTDYELKPRQYIQSNGKEGTFYSCACTYLNVKQGDQFKITTAFNGSTAGMCYYDSENVAFGFTSSPAPYSERTITVPENAVKVGITNFAQYDSSGNPTATPLIIVKRTFGKDYSDILADASVMSENIPTYNKAAVYADSAMSLINERLPLNEVSLNMVNGKFLQSNGGTGSFGQCCYALVPVKPGEKIKVSAQITENLALCYFTQGVEDTETSRKAHNITGIERIAGNLVDKEITMPVNCYVFGFTSYITYDNKVKQIQVRQIDEYFDEVSAVTEKQNTILESTMNTEFNELCAKTKTSIEDQEFDKAKFVFVIDDSPDDAGLIATMLSTEFNFPTTIAASEYALGKTLLTSYTEGSVEFRNDFATISDLIIAEENYGGETIIHECEKAFIDTTTHQPIVSKFDCMYYLSKFKNKLESLGLVIRGYASPNCEPMDYYMPQLTKLLKYGRQSSSEKYGNLSFGISGLFDQGYTDIDTWKTKVNEYIAAKKLLVLTTHGKSRVSLTTLKAMIQYVKEKSDAGQIDVVSLKNIYLK